MYDKEKFFSIDCCNRMRSKDPFQPQKLILWKYISNKSRFCQFYNYPRYFLKLFQKYLKNALSRNCHPEDWSFSYLLWLLFKKKIKTTNKPKPSNTKCSTKIYLLFTGCHHFPKMCFFSSLQAYKNIATGKETITMANQQLLEWMQASANIWNYFHPETI